VESNKKNKNLNVRIATHSILLRSQDVCMVRPAYTAVHRDHDSQIDTIYQRRLLGRQPSSLGRKNRTVLDWHQTQLVVNWNGRYVHLDVGSCRCSRSVRRMISYAGADFTCLPLPVKSLDSTENVRFVVMPKSHLFLQPHRQLHAMCYQLSLHVYSLVS